MMEKGWKCVVVMATHTVNVVNATEFYYTDFITQKNSQNINNKIALRYHPSPIKEAKMRNYDAYCRLEPGNRTLTCHRLEYKVGFSFRRNFYYYLIKLIYIHL